MQSLQNTKGFISTLYIIVTQKMACEGVKTLIYMYALITVSKLAHLKLHTYTKLWRFGYITWALALI